MRTPTDTTHAIAITDARTRVAHFVTVEALAAGRRAGRYAAVCGTTVLAASMITEERDYCRACIRGRTGQCHGVAWRS